MRPATTVERKVYFYRAYLGLDDDSCSRLLDLTASLTHIEGLAGAGDRGTERNGGCIPSVMYCLHFHFRFHS